MTPDELLAALRTRLEGVDALASGRGDPLDLPAVLLPEVADDRRHALALALADRPDVAAAADVDGAPDDARPQRLAVVAALAALARHLPRPQPWQDLVDEVRYDLLARPHAYRDLSGHALLLAESLDLTEETPHGSLLRLAARAALDAASQELLVAAERRVLRSRRSARARRWRGWLEDRAAPEPILQAIEHLEHNTLPLAAADGAPDALARVRLGVVLDGEICLAVVPAGVLLEWDGRGAPPDGAGIHGQPLVRVAGASLAAAAWWLPAPEQGPLEVTLHRGDDGASIRWSP